MDTVGLAKKVKEASFKLASIGIGDKNRVIKRVAELIEERIGGILDENRKDLARAEQDRISDVLYKRLVLNEKKLSQIVESLSEVASLPDPTGVLLQKTELDEQLILEKVTVPIGVIGIIFESRPDALVQIASLCIKSGNAAILKGGKEAAHTNRMLFSIFEVALEEVNPLFRNSLQLVESREDIKTLLALDEYIDLMIPRGSNELVRFIKENTKVPVLGHADGICHVYVDEKADLETALSVAVDSKIQYPAVCNALETLLVQRDIAPLFLPSLKERLETVELKGDEEVREIIDVAEAVPEDWRTEYNDLVLSIKIVSGLEEAVDHINRYGSHHTDSIVTRDEATAEQFLNLVDSASVMWNCSTRFADGFRYGLGAEVGISTNKIHARGPVGLDGLVTYKFRLMGSGQIVADYADGKKTFTHKIL